MQGKLNFRIWYEDIKLKLGAYKAFFSLFPVIYCHDTGKASYCTSLLFEDHHQRYGRNLFWGVLWIFFLKCNKTINGVTGICRGPCSIVGSILCVGLGQQRQPFLPQYQVILVYSDIQYDRVAFLESSNTMFSHTSGCKSQDVINTWADSKQPLTAVKALLHSAGFWVSFCMTHCQLWRLLCSLQWHPVVMKQ